MKKVFVAIMLVVMLITSSAVATETLYKNPEYVIMMEDYILSPQYEEDQKSVPGYDDEYTVKTEVEVAGHTYKATWVPWAYEYYSAEYAEKVLSKITMHNDNGEMAFVSSFEDGDVIIGVLVIFRDEDNFPIRSFVVCADTYGSEDQDKWWYAVRINLEYSLE